MRKHILLSLCGMSPAVITETVYELRAHPPEEVIVITTVRGHQAIKAELFSSGVWQRLITRLELPQLKFKDNDHHIRLLPAAESGNAEDIISNHDNMAMADFILGTLRQFTENPDTQITFSLAGGRKTMSAIGALSMSLLGRKNDELCHILVKPPFDQPHLIPRFYFPEAGVIHHLPDGSTYPAETAEITRCQIPYVQQRYLFTDRLNRLPGDYADMVQLANTLITKPEAPIPLELRPQSCSCRIADKEIHCSAAEFILLWLWATRCNEKQPLFDGLLNL